FRPLIDPCFEGGDLFRAQRPSGRHLRSGRFAGQPEIEPAEVAVPRLDHQKGAPSHGGTAAVETEAVHLLYRPVTANAVLLQQRLNVTNEIDFAGILGGRRLAGRPCTQNYTEEKMLQHRASRLVGKV